VVAVKIYHSFCKKTSWEKSSILIGLNPNQLCSEIVYFDFFIFAFDNVVTAVSTEAHSKTFPIITLISDIFDFVKKNSLNFLSQLFVKKLLGVMNHNNPLLFSNLIPFSKNRWYKSILYEAEKYLSLK
jgi:hypothetical protein